jgi:dihydroxyacetone kinase-like predicted kinase
LQTKVAANAQAMKRWLGKAETALGNHSDRLNAINIFPVADGDTGTNLYLTVRAAARALQTDASAHADTFQREPAKQESFRKEPFQKERVR